MTTATTTEWWLNTCHKNSPVTLPVYAPQLRLGLCLTALQQSNFTCPATVTGFFSRNARINANKSK